MTYCKRRLYLDFCRDERGAITPLMLTLFLGVLLITGVSMDLLKHEAERADLQAALDRGVLAAAALTQTMDSRAVVADYVRKGVADGTVATVSVSESGALGGRRIQASAVHGMQTAFLRMVGLSDLDVVAGAAARQGREKVEISLVLDISGTMREPSIDGSMTKLENLRIAANEFIDRITADGQGSGTTVNLVRYAGQVNPGPVMFDLLGGVRTHDESSCIELTDDDFATTGLPAVGTRTQVPHFHHWTIDNASMDWGWCPSDGEAVVYASSDATRLKTEIDEIRLHDGTGTYNAMKWGLALLDPTSRPAFQHLAAAGEIAPAHADRPLDWNDPHGEKILVLMTDGKITDQYRPLDALNPLLATLEVVPNAIPYAKTVTRADGAAKFAELCRLARENGVTVFTIAFEVLPDDRHEMEGCATSPSHFWYVEGREIADAFNGIRATIENLKLVN